MYKINRFEVNILLKQCEVMDKCMGVVPNILSEEVTIRLLKDIPSDKDFSIVEDDSTETLFKGKKAIKSKKPKIKPTSTTEYVMTDKGEVIYVTTDPVEGITFSMPVIKPA